MLLKMLKSLLSACSDPRSLEFLNAKPSELQLSRHAVHERFLTSMLECIPREEGAMSCEVAVAVCVLAHHPMMARSRGSKSAWSTVLASCRSTIVNCIVGDPETALSTILDDDCWGVESNDDVVSEAASTSLEAVGRLSGVGLFEIFFAKISEKACKAY
jgi:hypothetical protein